MADAYFEHEPGGERDYCPSCYFHSQVSHDLYTFSYRICHSDVSSPFRALELR